MPARAKKKLERSKVTVKPGALKAGDRVALLCPSSRPESAATVERCRRVVEEMGFQPVIGKHVLSMHGYMAGTDQERLADLENALADPSIAGIFCLTGGFGALHLIEHLDYELIASNPKLVAGCDDNTSLLLAIQQRCNLVTFHAPNLDQISSRFSFERLKEAVTARQPLKPISALDLPDGEVAAGAFYAPVRGAAEGKLIGGNLTALVSLMGTPFEPGFDECVLFLEDKNERNDILDRWFTTLHISGALARINGVGLGQFYNCGPKDSHNLLSLEDLFGERLKALGKTSCFGLPLGQSARSATVPLGIRVALDTDSGQMDFAEAALV